MKRTKLKRRIIPIAFALFDLGVWIGLIGLSFISETTADRFTLLNLGVGYLTKTVIFAAFRIRMKGDGRDLTFFGWALADFFSALLVLSTILTITTFSLFSYAMLGQLQPTELRLFNRLAINFGVWLTCATGVAVLWEMSRSPKVLEVHPGDASLLDAQVSLGDAASSLKDATASVASAMEPKGGLGGLYHSDLPPMAESEDGKGVDNANETDRPSDVQETADKPASD